MIPQPRTRPVSETDPERLAQLALDGVPLGVKDTATLLNALGMRTEKGRPFYFQLVCMYEARAIKKLRDAAKKESW